MARASNGIRSTGRADYFEDELLPLQRYGFTEECYFSYSPSPVRDDRGVVKGLFTAVTETTRKVIGERRLQTLSALSKREVALSSASSALTFAADVLRENQCDLPFFGLYLRTDAGLRRVAMSERTPARLLPETLSEEKDTSPWPALRAREGLQEVALTTTVVSGPWPESIGRAAVVPLRGSGEQQPCGYFVTGISSRLAFERTYSDFLELVAGSIAMLVRDALALEEERQRVEQLAELDRQKSVFFSNVSHEFRTPLTLMLGPSQDALEDSEQPLGPRQRERVELVRRNANRLLRLVNALLDFSRIEAGRLVATPIPTDLAQLTADLASNFRSLMERAGLAFHVHCPPLPRLVQVDRGLWERVVLNLLSNAFKITLEGSVSVSLMAEKEGIALAVSDTGIGIEPEQLPKVFDRFHRVEGAQGRSIEGSGIGLALVQQLVKLHGGAVSVESEPGRGTRFTVRMPFGENAAAAAPVRERGPSEAAAFFVEEASHWEAPLSTPRRSAGAVGAGARLPRIVLADDNVDMRDYVRRTLRGPLRARSLCGRAVRAGGHPSRSAHAGPLRRDDAWAGRLRSPGRAQIQFGDGARPRGAALRPRGRGGHRRRSLRGGDRLPGEALQCA